MIYNITLNKEDDRYLDKLTDGMLEYLESEGEQVLSQTTLRCALEYAFERLYRDKELDLCITVRKNKKSYILQKWKILYVERDKRDTYIYLNQEDSVLKLSDKLTELEERLCDENFVRCHNSFIVNMSYVSEHCKTGFVMKNGMEIPISRSRQNEVSALFEQWKAL